MLLLYGFPAVLFEQFGRDMGCDIPTATNYVEALKPLLGG